MTDADRSPFRRFPWVQLVFCLACLTMTAWTWMRYSYCWRVERQRLAWPTLDKAMLNYYVEATGALVGPRTRIGLGEIIEESRAYLSTSDLVGLGNDIPRNFGIEIRFDGDLPAPSTVTRTWRGRIGCDIGLKLETSPYYIDTASSRFHPASVAGLVVGAMGVFVFGLYLRRWVKERRTSFTAEGAEVAEGSR